MFSIKSVLVETWRTYRRSLPLSLMPGVIIAALFVIISESLFQLMSPRTAPAAWLAFVPLANMLILLPAFLLIQWKATDSEKVSFPHFLMFNFREYRGIFILVLL